MNEQQIYNSPTLLIVAINAALDNIHTIGDRYRELTGVDITGSLPESIEAGQVVDPPADPSEPVYGPNGATLPRADGCVRIKALDEAYDAALESDDEVDNRWGQRARRWVYVQDLLDGPLTDHQRIAISLNCAHARLINAIGLSESSLIWEGMQIVLTPDGWRIGTEHIPDAQSWASDNVRFNGEVRGVGLRIKDAKRIAKASLDHFRKTSGRSTLSPGEIGSAFGVRR